jgi:hypothetical protein
MTFDYDEFLKTARERLETLYEQKAKIENEIDVLESTSRAFAPLAKEPGRWLDPGVGITEAITTLLKSSGSRLFTPPLIRDELLKRGVLLEQKNPLATIHQVLARLVGRGKVAVIGHSGGNHYGWSEALEAVRKQGLKERKKARRISKTREATGKVAPQKGQVKTDDAASTKTE